MRGKLWTAIAVPLLAAAATLATAPAATAADDGGRFIYSGYLV